LRADTLPTWAAAQLVMMIDPDHENTSDPVPLARRTVLPYQGILPTKAVTVHKFYDAFEAQLYANELAAHGIDYYLLNQNANVLGPYAPSSLLELQVREQDVAETRAVLSRFHVNPAEVEPAGDSDPTRSIPDPAGEGRLVSAAAYDTPRRLFDAAATLGAARVECFLPLLVPRGDRPPGQGNRFVLWVREADAEPARETLARADSEQANDQEPRCPKCGSYRVDLAPPPWPGLLKFLLGARPDAPRHMQCFRCGERWRIP
jgi:hypothetical protein